MVVPDTVKTEQGEGRIKTETPKIDRLRLLQLAYRASLTVKADDLGACWQNLSRAQDPTVPMQRMRTLVHRLAGSAGMYGYNGLSRRARCLLGVLEALSYPFDPHAYTRAGAELDMLLHELRCSAAPVPVETPAASTLARVMRC